MNLFEYEGYQVVISPEALILKPFKKIWTRDKSKSKNRALSELGFIYFFCDSRSDYQYLVDEGEREQAIKEGEGLPDNWKPDAAVQEAIEFYNSFKTPSIALLESTRLMADNLRKNLEEATRSTLDVKELKDLAGLIKQSAELVITLNEVEKKVTKEVKEESRMKGQREKTILEDGF